MATLKIKSDGVPLPMHTEVVIAETGERVSGVQSVTWKHAAGEVPVVVIELSMPATEIVCAGKEPTLRVTAQAVAAHNEQIDAVVEAARAAGVPVTQE